MANSNTYNEGFTATQVTTLSHIQGAGLNLPSPTSEFIDIRSPNKLQAIFETPTNSNTLYTKYKPYDAHLKGPLSVPYTYTSIESGQRNKIKTAFDSSLRDASRVTKFLGSSSGTKFILKQILLQGFQPHDETKVYNPASPIISSIRLASFGVLDRPTRHIDTSNLISGLLGATGLGNIVNTFGRAVGAEPSVPPPPRSSVASEASRGSVFSLTTFTSLIGTGDRSDQVVSPLARPDVRDLLRGGTATNAYNSPRYSKLTSASNSGKSIFSQLLTSAGRFIQNNTLIGGIIPPKQPWSANYRADEQTYDLYFNVGNRFNDSITPTKSGFFTSILNSIGLGGLFPSKSNDKVKQRFFHASVNVPSLERQDKYSYGFQGVTGRIVFDQSNTVQNLNNLILQDPTSGVIKQAKDRFGNLITTNGKKSEQLKYTDLIKSNENEEISDQLLNYKLLSSGLKTEEDMFRNQNDSDVKSIIDSFKRSQDNIVAYKYDFTLGWSNIQQFSNERYIGFDYLNRVKSLRDQTKGSTQSDDYTYEGRYRKGDSNELNFPSIMGKNNETDRFIRPTNNKDYVNSLNIMDDKQFINNYLAKNNQFGPDIIKFFFYDIVNQKYIPFNATVKNITDNNRADWETIEYVGRADKLYYYKGFTRDVTLSFTCVAGSVKELLPMWKRINYLIGLTKPSNYTDEGTNGFIIPPMVQLTLGDFFKNHFVILNSCNVTIPDEASWEILPDQMAVNNSNWFWGPNKINFLNKDSKGTYAQFPMVAEISLQMNILEKDRPKVGNILWGHIGGGSKFSEKLQTPDYEESGNIDTSLSATMDTSNFNL